MFEVRCLVGDKSLHRVLHAVSGLTIEPPVVLSTTVQDNAVVTDNPRVGNETSQEAIRSFIANQRLTKIKPSQMREYLNSNGWSRNAYSHALNKLVKEGLLKKSKTEAHTYEVITNG